MQTRLELAAQHLTQECCWLDLLLRRQVLRLRVLRQETPDQFRGLYIADAEVDLLLENAEDSSSLHQLASLEEQIRAVRRENREFLTQRPDAPLSLMNARFRLSPFECDVFLIALAPDLDLRYQILYAYVQNDVTRKGATVDLILKLLCSRREEQWSFRQVFSERSTLFCNGLLQFAEETPEPARSLLARSVKVSEQIVPFLLGQERHPSAPSCLTCVEPRSGIEQLVLPEAMRTKLKAVAPLVRDGGFIFIEGREGSGKFEAAAAICAELGRPIVSCDLNHPDADRITSGLSLRRECLLSNAGLYLKWNAGFAASEKQVWQLQLIKNLEAQPFPIFVGSEPAKVQGSGALILPRLAPAFHLELDVPETLVRSALWRQELNGSSATPAVDNEINVLAGKFRFTPGQIRDVVREAYNLARLRGPRGSYPTTEDLYAAARSHGSPALQRLAQKVELLFGWNDLVLPETVLQQLQEVATSVRLRHIVHSEWCFDSKVGKNAGASVLFSGLSGTGKTMAASVLARELNLDLYKIDLSGVVSKYVGETEKNLSRIFDEAEYSSAILFFDEADALFGKRSEVKDAHDRYANIEVAFLLQRMEQFSGLAILATNISRNIDAAFARRMQHIVEFPFPDPPHRERIWRGVFPSQAPLAADVDFSFLARQFELSGGNIRNVAMAAAFLAAGNGRVISMEHFTRAIGREYQKLGKLPSKAEFREHFPVISAMLQARPA